MENTNSIEQAIPRFEIGQRVVIIGKTMQPFTDSLEGYLDSPTITLTASHLTSFAKKSPSLGGG